jgi:YesN/AraC family two-component response regulator
MAIPIIVDGMYLGAIMAGQVRLPENDKNTELERILVSPMKNMLNESDMQEAYREIPVMPIERIRIAATMLHDLCKYIVGEAISKNLIMEIYGRNGKGKSYRNGETTSNYPTENIEKVRRAMGRAITDAYVKATSEDKYICKNPTIRPAFEHIYKNKNDNISQKQMADICHISTSHFSRLFSKETGESFSSFLARLKVEWAKQLLEKTDLSITLISDELGFSEPSYFIKTFKKFEKTTPAVYRKYFREMR